MLPNVTRSHTVSECDKIKLNFAHLMSRHDLYGETDVVWNYLLLYITSPSYVIVEFSRMLAFRFVTIRLRLPSPSMFIT